MANVQDFIRETTQHIQEDRREGERLVRRGWIFHRTVGLFVWAIGAAAIAAGMIHRWRGFSWPDNYRRLHRPFDYVWTWMDVHHPYIWAALLTIAPPIPDGQSLPLGLILWVVSWLFILWGTVAFSRRLKEQGKKLKDRADETDKQLRFFTPLLHSFQSQHVQMNAVGDVSGSGNVINAVNTVNNVQHQGGKDEGWWKRPIGSVIIGVVVQAIAKWLGLT